VFFPGESQGREAWWAAIYGVAQSRTRTKVMQQHEAEVDVSLNSIAFFFYDLTDVGNLISGSSTFSTSG